MPRKKTGKAKPKPQKATPRKRLCCNPDCDVMFVPNRPWQDYCSDECRYHAYNKKRPVSRAPR